MKNQIVENLKKIGFRCNADARLAIAEDIKQNFGSLPAPNQLNLKDWAPVIDYVIEVGGAKPGTKINIVMLKKSCQLPKYMISMRYPRDWLIRC